MRRTVLDTHGAARAADLYRSGHSLADIAFVLRVGVTPVRNALLRNGVALRQPGRPRKERAA